MTSAAVVRVAVLLRPDVPLRAAPAFAATFLGGLDRWCARYAAEGPAALLAAWRTRKRPSREEMSDARE